MRAIIPRLHSAMLSIIPMVDDDTDAFNDYMEAMKLPKSSEAMIEARNKAMQEGLKTAIRVPMSLAHKTNSIWEPLLDLAECGNMNCKSDLQANKSTKGSLLFISL